MGNKTLGAFVKHRAQKILVGLWIAKLNYRILTHGGVTPLRFAENDLDNRIAAGHAAFFNSFPYTSFGYSSVVGRGTQVDEVLAQTQEE
jgi:hypothetical protein